MINYLKPAKMSRRSDRQKDLKRNFAPKRYLLNHKFRFKGIYNNFKNKDDNIHK